MNILPLIEVTYHDDSELEALLSETTNKVVVVKQTTLADRVSELHFNQVKNDSSLWDLI